jgi:hypothetical protein
MIGGATLVGKRAVVHGHTTVLQKWDIFRGNFACPESA